MRGLTDEEVELLRRATPPSGPEEIESDDMCGPDVHTAYEVLAKRGLVRLESFMTDDWVSEFWITTERGHLALRLHDIVRAGVAA